MFFLDDIEIWRAANSKVDIFLKKSAIEGRASAALRAAHISHTVVVSNMQDELGRELQTSRSLTPIHNGTGTYVLITQLFKGNFNTQITEKIF